MLAVLFRFVLIFLAAMLVRRLVRRGFANLRHQFGPARPTRSESSRSTEFKAGQPIEEAEFEELD